MIIQQPDRLVVEVDGPVHQYTRDQDLLRHRYLESLGLTVLRFDVEEVEGAIESVLARIAEALQ